MYLLSLLSLLICGEAALAQKPRLSSKVPINPLEPIGDWVWGKLINGFVYRARSSYGGDGGGSSLPTTGQVLASDKRFSTLLLALEIAFGNETGLDPPFTVFAPTAQAFNKLDNSTLSNLLQNPEDLAQVLLRHIIPGEAVRIPAGDISLTTASGDSINTVRISRNLNDIFSENVELTSGSGSARIVEFDIVTRDGVIHAIDTVV